MAKPNSKRGFADAGAWAIILCPETGKILLGKRSPWVNNGGFWNFFGGRLDHGEDPRDALVRELAEEAGLRIKQKQLVKLLRVPRIKAGGARERDMHYYLLHLDREVTPRLNREHSSFRWFKLDKLPDGFNRPTSVAIKQGLLRKAKVRASRTA